MDLHCSNLNIKLPEDSTLFDLVLLSVRRSYLYLKCYINVSTMKLLR